MAETDTKVVIETTPVGEAPAESALKPKEKARSERIREAQDFKRWKSKS